MRENVTKFLPDINAVAISTESARKLPFRIETRILEANSPHNPRQNMENIMLGFEKFDPGERREIINYKKGVAITPVDIDFP